MHGEMLDGRYRITGGQGRGGMGTVLRGFDTLLRRPVAIKYAHTEWKGAQHGLLEEAAALASLRHPNVVGVYAAGLAEGRPFVVLEFIEGPTLYELIETHRRLGKPMPVARAAQVVSEMASALAAAHALGIVHRDVKTANVIVEHGTGRTVLVDFGLSAMAHKKGQLAGSLETMPPEYLLDSTSLPSPHGDMYSLGCVAFEALTGTPVFTATRPGEYLQLHKTATPPSLSSLRPSARPFDAIVQKMLEKDPNRRFLGVGEAKAAIDTALAALAEGAADFSLPAMQPALNVLIVEPDPEFARLVARAVETALGRLRIAVRIASSASEALAQVRRDPPGLVILDHLLPDATGVEVLARLRTMRVVQEASVIAVSDDTDGAVQALFSSLGAERYLRKPVTFELLVGAVRSAGTRRGWLASPTADTIAARRT